MNFDIRWVIIGVVFILLLLVFGGNPGDDARRAQEQAAQDPDALIRAIEEHTAGGGGITGGGSALPLPDVSRPDPSSLYPSYLTRDSNPFAQGLDQPPPVDMQLETPPAGAYEYNPYLPPPAAAPPAAPSAQDSYYPPPPAPSLNYGPQSNLQFQQRLATGQPLGFFGTRVYTVNAAGKSVPMPDGVYQMDGSAVTLVIRDGHKLVIQ